MNANTQPTTTALDVTAAAEQIQKLKQALADADDVARLLLADPHFRDCPFVASIRGPVTAGIDRIIYLAQWLESNPIKPS